MTNAFECSDQLGVIQLSLELAYVQTVKLLFVSQVFSHRCTTRCILLVMLLPSSLESLHCNRYANKNQYNSESHNEDNCHLSHLRRLSPQNVVE